MSAEQAHNVTVRVGTIKGEKSYTLPQQTKVSELISKVLADFPDLPKADRYVLVRKSTGDTLDGDRPLVSYHFASDELLELTAIGGGA